MARKIDLFAKELGDTNQSLWREQGNRFRLGNGEDAICHNLNVRLVDASLLQLLRVFKSNSVAIFV
jgi:hypothetical protein